MEQDTLLSCTAWTNASFQRFSRGPETMIKLSHFLEEKVEMEKKLKSVRQEFLSKWDRKVKNCIGNNLPQDDLKEVMQKILAAESQKAEFHSDSIGKLQDPNGPIATLHEYIYGSGYMMNIINLKTLYNDTMERQKKTEKDVKQAKKNYHFLLRKESRLRSELEELGKQEGQNHKISKLQEELEEHECHVSRAKQFYHVSVRQEEAARPEFAADMEKFHVGSDEYEAVRLERVRAVLDQLLQDEMVACRARSPLERLYSEGARRLKQFEVHTEMEEHDKLFSYQYQFPTHDDKVDNSQKETPKLLRNESKRAKRREKLDKKTTNTDEVHVLKPTENNDVVLFQKSTKTRETKDDTQMCRPVPRPSSKPTKVDMSDFDLPNLVIEEEPNMTPTKKTTTINTGYDSDSLSSSDEKDEETSSDGSDTQMKLKLYAVKTFTARTPDEISFKRGYKVYMTQPENADGLAYGYVKKGKLMKKKMFGFFPAKLVSKDAKKKSLLKSANPLKKLISEDKEQQDGNRTLWRKLKMIS